METATALESPAEARQASLLEAIDAKHRTLGSMKKFAGIPVHRDITDDIATMIDNNVIRRVDNGTITAFFRYEQMPKRFWSAGGGIVEAEFEKDFTPRDEKAKAAEMNGIAEYNKPFSENGAKMTENRGPLPKGFARVGALPPMPRGRSAIDIDLVELEELAATLANAEEVAKKLGFKDKSSLYNRMKAQPDLKKAFDRGRDRNPMANKTNRGTKKGERRGPYKLSKAKEDPPAKKPKKRQIEKPEIMGPDSFGGEDYPSEDPIRRCADCEKPLSDWHLHRFCKSWNTDDSLEFPGDRATDAEKAKIRERFANLEPFTANRRQPTANGQPSAGVQYRQVDLANGGQIVVAFEGNIFDVTPDEHALLVQLSAVINTHKTETEEAAAG